MEENTSRQIKYFTTRYSLFKEDQMHINDFIGKKQTKEEVFDSFIKRLRREVRIQIPLEDNNFVMYYSGNISETRHLFKFAKETEQTLSQATVSDITETKVPDFPWCMIIVDTKEQIFLISKNSKISTNIVTLKNHIARAISFLLKESRVSLQLELMTNKHAFWDSVRHNSGEIRYIELTLISPNFLGQSYSTTKLLNELKDECNNDVMTWRLENTSGNLKISDKSPFFKDLLEYIANGCGTWKIKAEKKRTITSTEQAIECPLDADMFTLTASQIEDIQIAFSRIQAIENSNHEEGENNEESIN